MLENRHVLRVMFGALFLVGSLSAQDAAETARSVLRRAGLNGGLVVHLGCGEGRLTEAFRVGDSFLVHGLTRDGTQLAAGRRRLQDRGVQGTVSLALLAGGSLPYADSLVNLLVVSDASGVDEAEMMRVLAPGGTLCRREGDDWALRTKPSPGTTDEWTQFLYDGSNNAVSHDVDVASPRRMRWVGGPKWARSHEHQGTVSAVVSSGGRIFYIVDLGPTASIALPPDWRLVARDAYSGVVLWERRIEDWASHLRPFRSGPAHLPRRLVSVGERVYVTLGFGEPVSVLDAATGRTIKEHTGTENCSEIVHANGMLYVVCGSEETVETPPENGPFRWRPALRRKRLLAVNAETGAVLWRVDSEETAELMPLSVTVGGGRLFFHNTAALICLDAKTGKERWRAPRAVAMSRPAWSSPNVVYSDGVVLCGDRIAPARAGAADPVEGVKWAVSHGGGGAKATVTAYAAATGAELWSAPCSEGYNFPPDVFVARGLVWTGSVIKAKDPGFLRARNLHTGNVAFERPPDKEFFQTRMGHHRCYRNRATDRFLVLGRAGVEFIDLATGKGSANHWVRGTCQYGIMPANGLLYVPPHSCACHLDAKLSGFNALDSGAPVGVGDPHEPGRLVRGEDTAVSVSGAPHPDDWSTFRHDAARSGATPTAVEIEGGLGKVWESRLGTGPTRLTAMTAAEGVLLVADRDRHVLHALDAGSGSARWTFAAGGRIDSPPTVFQRRVLCGSADGHVYCLRLSDGALCWRFQAAPAGRLVVSYGQLESAWPVSGSVLVQDGIAYVAAGRSGFLDGGIHVYGLEPATGRVVAHRVLDSRDPATGCEPANVVGDAENPRVLPDVLASDGESIFMRHSRLSKADLSVVLEPAAHLWAATGWLDDSWWHRSYWLYGPKYASGWGGWWQSGNRVPSGRILAFNDTVICGFGRGFMPAGNAGQWYKGEGYRVFGTDREFQTLPLPESEARGKRRRPARPTKSLVKTNWSGNAGVAGRALVLAADTLFVAGPTGDTHLSLDAHHGRKGAVLKALSVQDGTFMGAWQLPAAPVFDGMIAVRGRLFAALTDGRVLCLGAGGTPLEAVDAGVLTPVVTEPQKSDVSARPVSAVAAPTLPKARTHPDFPHVTACSIGPAKDGVRLASDGKAEGMALRPLDTPLTGRFRLKARFCDVPGVSGRYGNGFISVGDGTDPAKVISCGLRIRIKRLELYQGGLSTKRHIDREVPVEPTGVIDLELLVDLPTGEVTATVAGVTASGTIPNPPEKITHIGYCLLNAVTDFSRIEVLGP